MIVTGLSCPICGRSSCTPSTPTKISSNKNCGGASAHAPAIPSRNAASPQHTSDGVQSFIIATNSAGACREYSGTTISPSAMSARSIATHRILFAASNPHRSPFCSSREAINVRALRTSSSNSFPVTPVLCPSQISARIRVSAASRSCENISPIKGTPEFTICFAKLPYASLRALRAPPFASSAIKFFSAFPGCLSLVITSHQFVQPLAHRRQVILPTPLSPPRLELRISPLHFLLEVNPHARHHFQIPHHCLCNLVGDRLAFTTQLLQSRQQFSLKLRIVHRHQQILVPALPHQIPYPFIHRDSRRRHQSRHRRHNPVIP